MNCLFAVPILHFLRYRVDAFPPEGKICDFSVFRMRKSHLFFPYFLKR